MKFFFSFSSPYFDNLNDDENEISNSDENIVLFISEISIHSCFDFLVQVIFKNTFQKFKIKDFLLDELF